MEYGKPTLAARFTPSVEGGESGGPHRRGGVELPRWWPSVHADLCRTYPAAGVPDCGGVDGEPTRVPVDVPLQPEQ